MGKRGEGEAPTAHLLHWLMAWVAAVPPFPWSGQKHLLGGSGHPPRLNMLCFQPRGLKKQEAPMGRAVQDPQAEGNHFFPQYEKS